MGFGFGNAINAVADGPTRECLKKLGAQVHDTAGSVSTIIRDGENVQSHADLTDLDYASSGHTGFASSASIPLGADPTGTIGVTAVNGTLATFMRSDSAPAFDMTIARNWTAGVHTFTALDVHNGGIDLGTSGLLTSAVANAASAIGLKYKPATALTSGTDRDWHSFQDSSGNVLFVVKADGSVEFGGRTTTGGYINVGGTRTGAEQFGINFIPTFNVSGGSIAGGQGWTAGVAGAVFGPKDHASATFDTMIGGFFAPQSIAGRTHARIIGGYFPLPLPPATTATYGDYWGWYVNGPGTHAGATVRTINNIAAGYVVSLQTSATSKPLIVNNYGLAYVEEQKNATTINNGLFFANATAGYKAIAFRDQNAWIGSDAAAELTIGGTNCRIITTNIGFFGVAAVARPGAFTQTYSTASHTHANPTAAAVATTAATNIAPYGYTTSAQADDIITQLNKLVTDMANVKQTLNAVIDDGQSLGLLQ